MTLAELKKKVRWLWEARHWIDGASVQPENFESEIRQYGDLRRKSTWVEAMCRLKARNTFDCCLDAYELITIQFNIFPEEPEYPYRHQIFEEFLAIPEALELLKTGFEQLFSSDFTTEEREEARGFFAMVEEQSARRRIEREPTELIRQVAELAGAAAR